VITDPKRIVPAPVDQLDHGAHLVDARQPWPIGRFVSGNYEGNAATPELPQNVYRVDEETGQANVVASDLRGPNGLCFSPDETKLYVVEFGRLRTASFGSTT
jgi:sugar lactone lactonase YvrE